MNTVLYIAGMIILIILVLAGSFWMSKNNVGAWTAVNPSQLIYSKDIRTDICYAQGSKLLATVPCEKVEKYLE